MIDKLRAPRHGALALALGGIALLCAGSASAVILNGFKDTGLEHIYGSYAPGGNCAAEPRLTIDDKGITFRASGRTVLAGKVDYSPGFYGGNYEGIVVALYPFPAGEFNPGPVLMIVNADEKRGLIRIEADVPRGQRVDPFHAALAAPASYTLCAGTAPANRPEPPRPEQPVAVPGIPMEWTNLPSLVGKYPGSHSRDNIDLFDKGAIAAALKSRLGPKMDVLETNLEVKGPLQRQGNLYFISGNAQHKGGEEQAYVLIDAARRAVQVGLWEKGKLTVYAPAQGARIPLPADLATMVQNSPPETAVALPGTPWELVPVQGRAPLAYVSAAGSSNIESLSLYCENGRPYMAMLLNKPARAGALTMTWNFAGRLVNIPVQRAGNTGTQWIGPLAGTQVVPLLMQQTGTVMLRLNGNLEGEASLANARPVLRTALQPCLRL